MLSPVRTLSGMSVWYVSVHGSISRAAIIHLSIVKGGVGIDSGIHYIYVMIRIVAV